MRIKLLIKRKINDILIISVKVLFDVTEEVNLT